MPDHRSVASISTLTAETSEKHKSTPSPPRSAGNADAAGPTTTEPPGAELAKAQTHDPNFEVSWDGPDDPDNPRSMSNLRKWVIVWILALTSTCVTCTSSLYTSIYDQIEAEFGISRIVATLGLSIFVIGLGLGPMLLAPLSEFYGRRSVYIVSLTLFLIWFAPCAAAMNIQTLLIGRFFSGLCGAAFLSVAGGTVGDMFTRDTLQAPMVIFSVSPL